MSRDGIRSTTRVEIVGQSPRALIERSVHVAGAAEPYAIGMHDAWAEKYRLEPGTREQRPTSNDMFVGALAACMLATFASALEARTIPMTGDHISAEATADFGPADDGAWIVRFVLLRIRLTIPVEHHDVARRVSGFYDRGCLLSQTLRGGRCRLETELEFA